MAKTWNSYSDAQLQAATVIQMVQQGHKLPPELVDSLKASMQKARPGLVQEFYNKLTAECPDALKYFTKENV